MSLLARSGEAMEDGFRPLRDGSFGASALQNPSSPSAPTLTSVSPLTGTSEDTAFTITYAALAAAADEADAQGDPIAFRVESPPS